MGGPIYIPKVYDGRNKSFLFFSFEEFRENVIVNTIPAASGGTPTVPTQAYRNGNFSQVITGQNNIPVNIGSTPYIDPLGNSYPSGTIFNPHQLVRPRGGENTQSGSPARGGQCRERPNRTQLPEWLSKPDPVQDPLGKGGSVHRFQAAHFFLWRVDADGRAVYRDQRQRRRFPLADYGRAR